MLTVHIVMPHLTLCALEAYWALTVGAGGHVDARGPVHTLVVVAWVDVVLAVGPGVTLHALAAVVVGAVDTSATIQTRAGKGRF